MDQTNVRVVSVKDPASDRHVGQLYRPRIVVSVGSHRLQNMVKSVCFHKKRKNIMWNNTLGYFKLKMTTLF